MSLFDIDYNVLVKILLPTQMRNSKMKAWLNVLVSPIVYIYNAFMTWRYDHLYVLSHNSQVCYMQAILNDAFDSALRRIVIKDRPNTGPVSIYRTAETHPKIIYRTSENQPVFIYKKNEFSNGFIVEVPAAVTFDNGYMRALIDKFRLASKKNYIIKIV